MKNTDDVNNAYYQTLGEKWYSVEDDPIALLRAESKLRNKWTEEKIAKHFSTTNVSILDIGCGAGFLTNHLAQSGYKVTGLDLFSESLSVAKLKDTTQSVNYVQGDALKLPFENETFDVVCMMDFLEHVDDVNSVISEASRVLKPNGFCFFHTFNRNFLSWLFVIKGVEWFVKNTPQNLHVYHLFIKPTELMSIFEKYTMVEKEMIGLRPNFFTRSFYKMIFTGRVDNHFEFKLSKSLLMGYSGYVQKIDTNIKL